MVEGSNYVDVNFKIDPRTKRIIMMGAMDNLVKGAAGQAVQNMNLMFGLPETRPVHAADVPVKRQKQTTDGIYESEDKRMKKIEGGITAAKGFQAAGGAAGIKNRA